MATITARKTKAKRNQPATVRYTAQVRYHGKNLTKTWATKEAAINWAKEIETNINQGKPVSACTRTLGKLIERFEETELKPPRFKPSGNDKLRQQWDWWKANLGEHAKLGDITKPHVTAAIDGLILGTTSPSKRKLEGSTINHYLDALSVLLQLAVDLDWIEYNVVERVKRRPINGGRTRWLTRPEQDALLKAALEDSTRGAGERCWLWIRTALTAGARQGELAQLTWLDINFEKAQITLRGINTDDDVEEGSGGTKNGETRIVRLHPDAAAALKKLKNADVVAAHPFGEYPRKAYETAIKNAGLKHGKGLLGRICFHTLRHTCATMLAADGVSAHDLQRYMGWKTQAMADRYVHKTEHLSDGLRAAVDKL